MIAVSEKVGAWLAVPEKVGKGKPAEKVGAWLAVPEKAGEGKPAEKAARKEAGEDNAIPVQIKLWKSGMTITHNCIHTSRCERQWAG